MSTRDRRLLIGASLFLVVDVARILYLKMQSSLLDGGMGLHPFLRTFVKSCSLTIFLIKLAADAPWTRVVPETISNGRSYSSLSQDEEEAGSDEDRFFDQSAWIPVRREADDGSDRSSAGSLEDIDQLIPTAKKRSKVRFSKYSEVRTLTASEADDALFARLSYQASRKAEAEAAKAANRLKPLQTARLALKMSFIHFSALFLQLKVESETSEHTGTLIFALSCVFSLIYLFLCSSKAAESDRISLSQVVSCSLALVSLMLVAVSLANSKSFTPLERLEPLLPHVIGGILSAAFHAVYVQILRKEVVDADRLDVPLFMGVMGFFQVTLAWPGFFFFVASDQKPSFNDSWSVVGTILLGDIFMSMIELLWIWSCLSTSVLITFVSLFLRLPLSIIMSAFIFQTTFGFWMGSVCLLVSFMILVTLTNWRHLSFPSHNEWYRVSQDTSEEHYVLTQDS